MVRLSCGPHPRGRTAPAAVGEGRWGTIGRYHCSTGSASSKRTLGAGPLTTRTLGHGAWAWTRRLVLNPVRSSPTASGPRPAPHNTSPLLFERDKDLGRLNARLTNRASAAARRRAGAQHLRIHGAFQEHKPTLPLFRRRRQLQAQVRPRAGHKECMPWTSSSSNGLSLTMWCFTCESDHVRMRCASTGSLSRGGSFP